MRRNPKQEIGEYKSGDVRFDRHGRVMLLSQWGKWLMVRRPGCVPYVVSTKEWEAMVPPEDID